MIVDIDNNGRSFAVRDVTAAELIMLGDMQTARQTTGGTTRLHASLPIAKRLHATNADWTSSAARLGNRLIDLGKNCELAQTYQTGDRERHGGQLSAVQAQGADWLAHCSAALLCDEMGTGKTVQTCAALEALGHSSPGPQRVLVVCPASVIASWCEHVTQWTSFDAVPLTGAHGERAAAVKADDNESVVFIVSWATLPRMISLTYWPTVNMRSDDRTKKVLDFCMFDAVVFDEAHRAKEPKARQTRAAWTLNTDRRWALTGTPVMNRPEDMWSMLRLVDPKSWPSKRKFVAEFCDAKPGLWGGIVVEGWQHDGTQRLTELVAAQYRRKTMAEAIGRNIEKVRQQRIVTMTTPQAAQYRGLVDEWKICADPSNEWTPDALTRLTRLTQCASAPLTVTDEGTRMEGPSPKVAELRQILEDLSPTRQVVVFTPSLQLLRLAEDMLIRRQITHTVLVGETDNDARGEAVQQFNAGTKRVFLGTTSAAGEGLDLACADVVVHLSKSWSYAMTAQAEDRVRRWTQNADAVLVISIVTEGTVEQQIEAAHRHKKGLLDALKPKEAR